MTAERERVAYPRGLIVNLLENYQRLCQNTRLPDREERLGTRPPPLNEAPWSATSAMKADLERALSRQPFERMQITFMALCMGGSSWRTGDQYSWRMRVADWWGLTPAEVTRIKDETISAIAADLNRPPMLPVY